MQVKDMDMDDLNDGSDLDFSGSDLHPASDIFSVTPLEGHATFFPEIAFLTMLGGPWHQRLPMTEGFRACYAIWLGGLFVTSLSAVRFCDDDCTTDGLSHILLFSYGVRWKQFASLLIN